MSSNPKVIGIVGWSGCGKTTLIEAMLPYFKAQDWRVSVIKHSHHQLNIDYPGKDSDRFRVAGSHEVLLTSPTRWALLQQTTPADEMNLAQCLARLSACDCVLVEGFKYDKIDKIEVYRADLGRPRLDALSSIVAVATDAPERLVGEHQPVLNLNDPAAVAQFIMAHRQECPPQ